MPAWSEGQLEPWRRDPSTAGVFLDFDGTLAPIVDDPQAAAPLPGVGAVLADLAGRCAVVAVISGRPAAFLAAAFSLPGVELFGSYGLERVVAGIVLPVPEAEVWRPAVREVVATAGRDAPSGVGVEDKGISLTLHTRTAPEHGPWIRRFAATQAAATGLVVHEARQSVELRPPLDVDKGSVVRRIAIQRRLEAACFIGDDLGDLPALAAVGELRHGLRVAVRSAEAPAELLAAADVVVDGPPGALAFLRAVAQSARAAAS